MFGTPRRGTKPGCTKCINPLCKGQCNVVSYVELTGLEQLSPIMSQKYDKKAIQYMY